MEGYVGVGHRPAGNIWKPATDLRGSECNYVVISDCVSFIQITVPHTVQCCSNQFSSAQAKPSDNMMRMYACKKALYLYSSNILDRVWSKI